jgi:hypothetical protein
METMERGLLHGAVSHSPLAPTESDDKWQACSAAPHLAEYRLPPAFFH